MNPSDLHGDYDWTEAFGFADFGITDVNEIIAISEGENDGEPWIGVFKLNNGRFAFLTAWCDYTGWDCQSGGDSYQNDSLASLIRWDMNSSARRRLNMALPDLDDVPNRNH